MKQTPTAAAALMLAHSDPGIAITMLRPTLTPNSTDEGLIVALALSYSKLAQPFEALSLWTRLTELRPKDVEVWVALADCAMECMDLRRTIEALEIAFKLDAKAETPAGRRARLLAVRLEKRLGQR